MQDDYARFMNYSDGRYHADYLLYKRSHGQNIPGMAPSKVVKYADITDEMWDRLKTHVIRLWQKGFENFVQNGFTIT